MSVRPRHTMTTNAQYHSGDFQFIEIGHKILLHEVDYKHFGDFYCFPPEKLRSVFNAGLSLQCTWL